jgi:hypothetical protein
VKRMRLLVDEHELHFLHMIVLENNGILGCYGQQIQRSRGLDCKSVYNVDI